MFTDEILALREADDDHEIVAKFRAWCAGRRAAYALPLPDRNDSDEEFERIMNEVDTTTAALFALPANSALGFAIKTYVWIHGHLVRPGSNFLDDDPREASRAACSLPDFYADPKNPTIAQAETAALIRDIARLAPELAPLCAGIYSEGEPAADEDRQERASAPGGNKIEAILAAAAAEKDALAGMSASSGLSLAELIGAAHRAWAAESPVRSKADELWFAWRDADPAHGLNRDDIEEEDRPEPMGKLYRMANRLMEIANNLTDRVVTWVPDNLADAIRLIEFDVDRLEAEKIYDGLLTGLRAIASRSNIEEAASLPEAPVVVMFRDWLAAERRAAELGMNAPDDDPEFEAALQKGNDILDRIYATPATDLPSLAVKAHLRLYEEHGGKRGVEIGQVNFEVIGGFEGATDAELALARDLSRICPELLAPLLPMGNCEAAEASR
jgi:hypothetical protein